VSLRFDLDGIAGNDLDFEFSLTYSGVPLNITTYTLAVYLKASATTPDALARIFWPGPVMQSPYQIAGVFSGRFLCAPTSYAPSSRTVLTVTGTTFAAFSSASVNTGSFTAPPSGSVIVTVTCVSALTASTFGNVALAAHSTVTPLVSNVITWSDQSNLNGRPTTFVFLVTGLTPGTSYNFDLVGASGESGDVVDILAQGQTSTTGATASAAPVTMTVQAV
jgi:hypothetical protein